MSVRREGETGDVTGDGSLRPLVGWSFPFVMGSNANGAGNGVASLGRALGGLFPLGANGIFHGGIHFDEGTAGSLRQDDGVRVIADGEVVAYRLDDRYPRLTYPDGQKLLYSSSFVLVRHRLALPRAKDESQTNLNSAGATNSQRDTLDFFSLYMHLQDWKGYKKTDFGDTTPDGTAKARHMPFWSGSMRYRVGDRAEDIQKLPSVRARAHAAPISNVAGGSGAGTVPRTDGLSEIRRGIRVRATPSGGSIIGLLPQGAEFAAERSTVNGWVRITEIASDAVHPYVVGGEIGAGAASGYVYSGELEEMIVPSPLDSVVVLEAPYPIKSGQLVGYVGEYQVCKDATPLPAKPRCEVLHLEVFAGDQLSNFLEKSRAYANTASGEDKTRLRVMTGARLVSQSDTDEKISAGMLLQATKDSPSEGAWAKVQPMKAPSRGRSGSLRGGAREKQGNPLWVKREMSNKTTTTATNAWRVFPLQAAAQKDDPVAFEEIFSRSRLENQTDANKARDTSGVWWWRVVMAGASGRSICGWVCEKAHAGTHWESPWAWPGFNVVDNTTVAMVDMFKRGCHVSGSVFPDDATDFTRAALEVGNTPLIERIERAIGQREKLKGRVSRLDMSVAMRDPCIATNISRIIVRNENEWGGGMAKWEALSEHMRAKTAIWETEMARIKQLHWWSDVQSIAGFPASPVVYHFHPLGLIENFIRNCSLACTVETINFSTSKGVFKVSKESFEFIRKVERYMRKPYVPPGESHSGVTLGYGYDLGQQTKNQIAKDLLGFYTPNQIVRLQEVAGLSRDSAIARVSSLQDIEISEAAASALNLRIKRRYAQMVINVYPNVIELHPHCQGVLLSLVYNRGPGLAPEYNRDRIDMRKEMRQISEALIGGEPNKIPDILRFMVHLWVNTDQHGLVGRRRDEADLFDKGLQCDCRR